ncbi:MAG TPA: kelch repeat-containing protein [candidate division Zixibacteria bacterium]|nr:kelch repeat-containing protein [candidate division Zixibacteria bacterium]
MAGKKKRPRYSVPFKCSFYVPMLFGLMIVATAASAQNEWVEISTPSDRYGHAMAYDKSRKAAVLFGGSDRHYFFADTWTWNGKAWKKEDESDITFSSATPTSRAFHAMAYDSTLKQVVLFGGISPERHGQFPFLVILHNDTWVWNGKNWRSVSSQGPIPRYGHDMVYDEKHKRIVLYGGTDNKNFHLDDTWAWDGKSWRRIYTTGPKARTGFALAFDGARGQVVLFGGWDGYKLYQDTWVLDGDDWEQVSSTGPTARTDHSMAFDGSKRKVVLTGGYAGKNLTDTWEWNGIVWRQSKKIKRSPGLRSHEMIYDSTRKRMVIFGGKIDGDWLGDTWVQKKKTWKMAASSSPERRHDSSVVYDRKRKTIVLYGGRTPTDTLSDTYEWDGRFWSKVSSDGPGERWHQAMVYDSKRNEVILFGGVDKRNRILNDMWVWNGRKWKSMNAPGAPSRYDHAMSYDSKRDRIVLFGGTGESKPSYHEPVGDTWEWDGDSWFRVSNTGPDPRYGHDMVFDASRGRTVLFGGNVMAIETWEWNGSQWIQVDSSGPPARRNHAMVYDEIHKRVIIFGGTSAAGDFGCLNDTWAWDGNEWTLVTESGPCAREFPSLVFDRARKHVLLFGGSYFDEFPLSLGDTWILK